MSNEGNVDLTGALVEKIKPILYGQHPSVQGAVIGDLFAIYIAGHAGPLTEVREAMIESWLRMVRDLVEIYDQEQNSLKKKLKKIKEKIREK